MWSGSPVIGEEGGLVGLLLAAVMGVILLGTLGAWLIGGGKRAFKLGRYGPAGGAVCPRCNLPYSRHVLAMNLWVGKLERCPHCGKIAIVRRATAVELEEAELRWEADRARGALELEAKPRDLRRMIDESRYED